VVQRSEPTSLILFLIFEPEGLVNRWRLVKAYWKLYPFAH
jgi:branched-chain amino acid transport system permease protein